MRRVAGVLAVLALLGLPAAALGADPLRSRQWNLDMVQSDQVHSFATGAGAVVAVVDSGVMAGHPDLQGRLRAGYDFVQNDSIPQDENGHGTHVSGIVAANTDNAIGIASVAPGATILPVRVLDANGSGDSTTVAKGIDWAVAHGANVIHLSLGSDLPAIVSDDPSFDATIDNALDRGVIVVAAAGNSGLPVCDQPSGQGRLLCVGSVDKRRNRSYFSNFGNGLGLVAPGGSGLPFQDEDVLSTWNDGGYMEVAGTSQATPHVSGVAALLVSKGVRGQAAVRRILDSATDVGPPGPDAEFGAGIVNASRALDGLPGSPGGSGRRGGGGSAARVSLARIGKIRTVLRRGLRVRCLAAGSGRCRVGARRGRTRVAAGSRALRAGRAVTVTARVTPKGRKLLLRALKRHKRVRLAVRVLLPGASVRRSVSLRP
jgi:subtilisin family serine protease